MSLYFEVYPADADLQNCTPVVILPGLFGSSTNWRRFAKELSQHTPVIVLDLRNHGRSPHSDSHSYLDMAGDLHEFCKEHGLSKIIPCGHSMGGKVAMVFSLLYAERVASLLILDIAPITYTHSHAPFLDALLKVDLQQIESRKHADELLKQVIPEQSTRLFLLQSLAGRPGEFNWRLNLPVLQQYMPQIVSFPEQELHGKINDVPAALVYGTDSGYVDSIGIGAAKRYFKNIYAEPIVGAGHWLHIDQTSLVLRAVKQFTQKTHKND